MADDELDRSGSTQEFAAFMAEPQDDRRPSNKNILVVGGAIAAVVCLIVILAFAL